MPFNATTLPAEDWVFKAPAWPPSSVSIRVNEERYPLPRKENVRKPRPCDVTRFMKVGCNVISVVVKPLFSDGNKHAYFAAVDLIAIAGHSFIMQHVQETKVLSEQDTLDVIRSRLSVCAVDGDEENEILVDQELCISLTDPFSATRVKLPCRGSGCRHLDPFDLETWLETRPTKKKCMHSFKEEPGCRKCAVYGVDWQEPSLVDSWKCPICSADARPSYLVIDGFLKRVIESLAEQGSDATKAIYVNAEGKWRAKEEPPDDDDGDSSDGEGPPAKRLASLAAKTKLSTPAEVIVLDD